MIDHTNFAPGGRRLNIAVIGGGIAGMAAAWLLHQRHQVTVYERNSYIGGHSNTVDAPTAGHATPVDTGFIVYNEQNYPNLTALFRHFDVPTKPSEMSFAASMDSGRYEYAGTDQNGQLGQRRHVMRPRFWNMLRDLLRFYREAPELLTDGSDDDPSLGDYLRREKYGTVFIKTHLLPMGAAIWSSTGRQMEEYPARAFIRFFVNHGLVNLKNRPAWRTVDGGSRQYVQRLTASYRDSIRYGGVRALSRTQNGALVTDWHGNVETFDHVVVATHADEALRLLGDADPAERQLLGAWNYTQNRAVLHSDASLMPRRRQVWSSWNFIGDAAAGQDRQLCITYWMNRLQGLDPAAPLFVTLNPVHEPRPDTVMGTFDYAHPFFDRAALASQEDLWSLQGHRRTWFCGSYFGAGFHEDALQSGLAVAEQLGGLARPWQVDNANSRIRLPAALQDAAE